MDVTEIRGGKIGDLLVETIWTITNGFAFTEKPHVCSPNRSLFNKVNEELYI